MGQSIRDLMTENPCSIHADKSVAYAAKMMRDEDVGGRLVGVVAQADVARIGDDRQTGKVVQEISDQEG